jgi:FO synthase
MVWAVLPLKNFVDAKQRLSRILDGEERYKLFQMMVEDVLDVLIDHPGIEQIVIVSDDPGAAMLAERYGALCWSEKRLLDEAKVILSAIDPGRSVLSVVVDAAAAKLASQSIDSMMVVHGDLPLLSSAELDRLLALHAKVNGSAVTIAHDVDKDGSNCVVVSPPNIISFQYGNGSYNKHCKIGKQNSAVVSSLYLAGAARDIDNPTDLFSLCSEQDERRKTVTFLSESGIAGRLMAKEKEQSDLLQMLSGAVALGGGLSEDSALMLAETEYGSEAVTAELMRLASQVRDSGFRNVITYSRKVFIPLTHLCRDVCHYCTFAQTPKKVQSPYMTVAEVLESVKAAEEQGCKEALLTLGEKPELRYSAARTALAEMGFSTTLEYVAHVAEAIVRETSVLPHINAGCMSDEEIAMLRPVSASMGIMLESASERLCEKGMPHYGSPDKEPGLRMDTIDRAGRAKVPFTSGILIGIGETRLERIESLLMLRNSHQKYGHLQEIIIQNFRAKEGTKMVAAPEPDLNELLWTIAVARLVFGSEMSIQAPPNLSPGVLPKIVSAGINDWGGISPITPDFVNPEAPWPHVDNLANETASAGKYLQERLTIYPSFAINGKEWLDAALQTPVLRMIDAEGFPRIDNWCPGDAIAPPANIVGLLDKASLAYVSPDLVAIVESARQGQELTEAEVVRLFQSRGDDLGYVCQAADQQRIDCCGKEVSFVVNRNINYTNICYFKCQFCAFSKGKLSENLRGRPYDLGHEEISRRCQEAWQRGATEVCMQGGIHPEYTGETYLDIVKAVKLATPDMHLHAFSPLEVWQGAATLEMGVDEFLRMLKAAGLNTLPGTAAEILDDDIRADLCPDKINTAQWLEVMEAAHSEGFNTTATIMYGHIEKLQHWARHLLRVRQLQEKTGGFTEFVPLPFVHMEAPLYLKGKSRSGPTFRESLLMHAVARLVLSPLIKNIQTSWVKMGEQGVVACLRSGANDLGGTLMNESITRAAGAEHGEEYSVDQMSKLIILAGRQPRQRSTDYQQVTEERIFAGQHAMPLTDVINTVEKKYDRKKGQKIPLIVNG